MTLSLAESAIALLIDLAERGEIDPWDVKVIDVIDRFLSKLQPLQIIDSLPREQGRAPYEANLSESGQAFLYASMLLLLKADSLARLETPEAEEDLESEALLDMGHLVDAPLPRNLERQIRRRATALPVSNRRVTLSELIAQLNLIAAAMADPKPRRSATRRPRPQSRSQAMRTIAELAHQENLSETAAILEAFLRERWHEVSQGEDWLDFEILLGLWSNFHDSGNLNRRETLKEDPGSTEIEPSMQITPSTHDRVGVFWALLFLSAQSKVELLQEEFYSDLKVRSLADSDMTPPAENASETSILTMPD